jgi:hypothetical protein
MVYPKFLEKPPAPKVLTHVKRVRNGAANYCEDEQFGVCTGGKKTIPTVNFRQVKTNFVFILRV